MKRKFIFKLIAGSVVSTTLFAGVPVKVEGAWKQDSQGNYYYSEGNGYSSGWRNIDGSIYFFDNNGVMQRGWLNYNDSWYFLDNYGVLKTGWINYNNNYYYSDSAGRMQTGIISVNGNTYYLAENGVMQTKNMIIDGQFYTIGSNGVIVGSRVPSPDKVFDMYGNCIQSTGNNDSNSISPVEQLHMQEMKDESEIGDYDAPTRKFKVTFRDYNGEEIESKTVKEGSSVRTLDADSVDGYNFIEWNTKSDGSGKGYDEDEKVKATSDINLYAIYKKQEEVTLVNSISISGEKEVQIGKEVQLTANIKPSNATSTKVNWTVINGTGEATIDNNGNITGVKAGSITVKAEAQDKSGKSAEYRMSVVEAKTLISSITISADNDANKITTDGGTLQLKAAINPENASNKELSWSIVDKDGNEVTKKASIDSNGLVKAIADTSEDNPIYAVASAKDGSGTSSNKYEITITGQSVKVDNITISSDRNYVVIGESDKNTLKLKAKNNAGGEVKAQWSIEGDSEAAVIDKETGVLKGLGKGKVKVKAEYGGRTATKEIEVINPVANIKIKAKDNDGKDTDLTIDSPEGSINLVAEVSAANGLDVTNDQVTWSIDESDPRTKGKATINKTTGKLTASKNGDVVVVAKSLDIIGYKVSAVVKIENQKILTDSITLQDKDGHDMNDDALTMYVGGATTEAQVIITAVAKTKEEGKTPTNKVVKWVAEPNDGNIRIEHDSNSDDPNRVKITVLKPGEITLRAVAQDGSGVAAEKKIKVLKYVQNVSFSQSEIYVTAGLEDSIVLLATVNDKDSSNPRLRWTIEKLHDDNEQQIDNNNVLYISELESDSYIDMSGDAIKVKQKAYIQGIGIAKVTATPVDGSPKARPVSQIVYVKPAPDSVTIESENSTDTIKVGDKLKINAHVNKSSSLGYVTDERLKDPIQDIEWKIGEAGDDGQVTYNIDENNQIVNIVGKKAGNVTIKATSKIDKSKSKSIVITVKDLPSGPIISNQEK